MYNLRLPKILLGGLVGGAMAFSFPLPWGIFAAAIAGLAIGFFLPNEI